MKNETGSTMITMLSVTGLLLAIAAGSAVYVRTDTRLQAAFEKNPRTFYAAEAGLNRGMGEFANIFLSFQVPHGTDFDPRTFKLGNEDVRYELFEVPGNPILTSVPAGSAFAGLNTILYRYTATSRTMHVSTPEVTLGVEFDVHNIPIFQFLAFYNRDLEILPGPDMNLHGRIHTNADLYLNSNATMRVEDDPPRQTAVQVSAAGDVYRGRKNVSECRGSVWVDMLEDGPDAGSDLDPLELPCNGSGTRLVPTAEAGDWLGSLLLDVSNLSVPDPGMIARGSGIYWERADLRIVLDLDSTDRLHSSGPLLRAIEVQDAAGNRDVAKTDRLKQFMRDNPGKIFYNDVPTGTCNDSSCAADRTRYNPSFAASSVVYRRADDGNLSSQWTTSDPARRYDYRRGGFFNNREGRWMVLLNIDLQALLAWNAAQVGTNRLFDPDDAMDGGIVLFATVIGDDSAGINNYGVRVFDSAELPFSTTFSPDPTGVTVVTDQAAYVQGHYNSTTKDPAAIMGDSLNVLSQNWEGPGTNSSFSNDLKSIRPRGERVPSDTIINAAFLAGVDDTTPGSYNGGLENYPRFHEDWSAGPQRELRYRGSFVSLGNPVHVNGGWVYGSTHYTAPVRNWDYDTDFNDAAKLPPLTPRFVFVQQIFFGQEFL